MLFLTKQCNWVPFVFCHDNACVSLTIYCLLSTPLKNLFLSRISAPSVAKLVSKQNWPYLSVIELTKHKVFIVELILGRSLAWDLLAPLWVRNTRYGQPNSLVAELFKNKGQMLTCHKHLLSSQEQWGLNHVDQGSNLFCHGCCLLLIEGTRSRHSVVKNKPNIKV